MSVTQRLLLCCVRVPVRCAGPNIFTSFSFTIFTLFFVKTAAKPASHICPTDSKDLYIKSGYMCAFLASFGRFWLKISADAVERMVAPVGVPTIWTGALQFISWTGASVRNVFAVHPVSMTAWCGPFVGVGMVGVGNVFVIQHCFTMVNSSTPPRLGHLRYRRETCRCAMAFRNSSNFAVDPPMVFFAVAPFWWPSDLSGHLLLECAQQKPWVKQ